MSVGPQDEAGAGTRVARSERGADQVRIGRPERGQELELRIDSLAHGGEGVARYGEGGYVVFVSGAIPGDRVRAEVVKRKRSYAHARAVEIVEPSPERIEPLAQHPGVAWQVLPYERQLQIKAEQVDDALRRIGKLDGFELEEIVPAVEQWRYRNKLEYSFGDGVAPLGVDEGRALGEGGAEGEGLEMGRRARARAPRLRIPCPRRLEARRTHRRLPARIADR